MLSFMFHNRGSKHSKRDLFRWNLGGKEQNNVITGNQNDLHVEGSSGNENGHTLVRKAGHQIGKVFEGGADLITAPAKWLAHMQENWLSYLIFGTIFMVCVLFIYCCIRRKLATCHSISSTENMVSKPAILEAMELAALRRSLPEV